MLTLFKVTKIRLEAAPHNYTINMHEGNKLIKGHVCCLKLDLTQLSLYLSVCIVWTFSNLYELAAQVLALHTVNYLVSLLV